MDEQRDHSDPYNEADALITAQLAEEGGFAPPTGTSFPSPSFAPRGWTLAAWIIIGIICSSIFALTLIGARSATPPPAAAAGTAADDPLGIMLMEMQSKYMVGAANLPGQSGGLLLSAAETSLDAGSIGQRQRFVALAAELGGLDAAAEELQELDKLIDEERIKEKDFQLSVPQQEVHRILSELYAPPPAEAETRDAKADLLVQRVSALAPDEADTLRQDLRWFGELALVPRGTPDQPARDAALAPAQRVVALLLGAAFAGGGAAIIGFISIIIVIVLAFTGHLRGGLRAGSTHHGIYAETFALWLVLFTLLQVMAMLLSAFFAAAGMLGTLAIFFVSLVALLWPLARGIPWRQVRMDIGWHLGRTPLVEPLFGIAGYVMALPVLAVGIGFTFVLMLIQDALSGPGPTFGPSGGPAHPIVLQAAQGDWVVLVQLLLLAAVAAPIVEETMFRGVLYRHLRDGTRHSGFFVSVFLSATISAFLFAMIHPQGWVAIPALMALAYAFALLREWRDSVVPSMIVHGISNFLVMTLLILALSG